MSGRKLGGGRILGNGKGLAPPSPARPPRARSPAAFSEDSSASRHSRNSSALNSVSPPSSSPLPDFAQDLTSNISLGRPADVTAANNRLVCPICEEEMVTLLQLNRHIDDAHQELPEAAQDEVKSWFEKQVLKAKRFQPLSLINQKLRGLEMFESNESQPVPAPAASASGIGMPSRPLEAMADPDELVTRKHWQRPTGSDLCTDPPCGKRLGPINGNINCRKCGRLFCEEHTMYQMKLSRSASHDPVRGYWCRVCETCYKSREGYNDHSGLLVDHTADFVAIRRKKVERQNLEIQRLEKRLTKLTRLLASDPEEVAASMNGSNNLLLAPLSGQKSHRKALEQSVVTWEDDAAVARCPFCQQEFGSWTFRRHHCRICGRVVCADPNTGCSSEIGLNVASSSPLPASLSMHASEKPASAVNSQLSVDIRMCRDCQTTVFSHREFAESVTHKPQDQRAYETLRQFERGIRQLMPSFQRALLALQTGDEGGGATKDADKRAPPPLPTHAQIQEAAKIRKRLTDAFATYDLAARRLRDLPSTSPTQLRLQKAIYAAASSFLHTHLIPLKSVPHMLRSQSSSSSGGSNSSSSNYRRLLNSGEKSASPRNGSADQVGGGGVDSVDTASLGGGSEASALETEERELRERLVVLEEQRFLVNEMIKNAHGARRFEEVGALTRNLEELDREIAGLRGRVSGVEERWEGLYAQGGL